MHTAHTGSGDFFVNNGLRVFAPFFGWQESFKEIVAQTKYLFPQHEQDCNCTDDVKDPGKISQQPGNICIKTAQKLRYAIVSNPNAVYCDDNVPQTRGFIKRYYSNFSLWVPHSYMSM